MALDWDGGLSKPEAVGAAGPVPDGGIPMPEGGRAMKTVADALEAGAGPGVSGDTDGGRLSPPKVARGTFWAAPFSWSPNHSFNVWYGGAIVTT